MAPDAEDPSYSRCGKDVRRNCVIDGDTLRVQGIVIRVADIDTPETSRPGCTEEKLLGERATTRLLELLNAGPFGLIAWKRRDEDRYGRKLRVLMRHGRSLGSILISEGLARPWTGKRQPWCSFTTRRTSGAPKAS
ncbi:thermonuclease family protein [Ancylobacter sp.]|uniref:thermonuclease family protein n=1 Tax=Ancylobacter sp. TaxID=1872567 RepID=UPI003C7D3400